MLDARPVSVSQYLSLTSEHRVAQAFWIFTFAVLAGIGAQIEIPHQPVPFTFQTLVVMLAGALLGKRNGFLSMSAYLALGAVGLPVFSGGGFGLARILGPTGGYLLAFPIAAFAIGFLLSPHAPGPDKSGGFQGSIIGYVRTVVSLFIGLLIIFSFGTIQLNVVYFKNWSAAFNAGFLIFSWWDLLKLAAAATIYQEFSRRLHHRESPDR
ncbi:MAG: biotin transporter BioY [Bacteroidota bacterium]